MPLLKLYGVEDAIEAHLLKHMLEQRGVPVFITGEHLQGGAGELPAGSMIDVWVPEDFIEEAENVLDDFCESLDAPFDEDEEDDELIGPDGYYNDDIYEDGSDDDGAGRNDIKSKNTGPEDSRRTQSAGDDGRENPWNRIYRK